MKKPKYKGFYNIVSNKETKEATIYIYGVIGGFNWDTFTFENTADKFVKDFKEIEAQADTIHVKINSPGGAVHDGLPIYNVLANSEKTIKTYVDGIAYSMAALIALAGDTVTGYKNSLFMVHNASTFAYGNSKQLQEEAEILQKYDLSLGTVIEEKLGVSSSVVLEKYLNFKDNFYTADEAKDEGFFDEVISNKKSAIPENINNMSSKELMEHYMKMNLDFNTNNKTQNTMSKERKNLQGVLNLETPLAATPENGSYLNEDQLDAVETAFETHATSLQAAQDATQTAKDALATEQQTVTDLSTSINALAEEFDVEKGETVADTLSAIKKRMDELGQKPGAEHTRTGEEETKAKTHEYIDFSSEIYQN